MRKLTILLLVIISLFGIKNSFAQIANWGPLKRLTYGYKDSNPDFCALQNTFYYSSFWEFMVFQRKIDTVSQICVIRFDRNGPIDTARMLTTNNYFKRNPCVASRETTFNDTLRNALILWETNQNGKWDIYGSYYTTPTGWSAAFPVDSGAGNKFNPKAVLINSAEYGITYTKDDDIIYRRYNAQLRTVVSETNITSSISTPCSYCLIATTSTDNFRINFRSKKIDNNYCIYKAVSSNNGSTWTALDTLAYTGNNLNVQLAQGLGNTQQIFESNRSGRSAIYNYSGFGPNNLETAVSSPYFNYYGLKTWIFPIITDNNSSIASSLSAVVRKSNDSTKIMFNLASSSTYARDSISAGDTSKNITIALSTGIRYEDKISFFAVFNLDTAGFTSLYYRQKIFITTEINQISNNITKEFYLYQNYPNPFNPTTKIKFDIPKLSDVKLIIFDAVGREVKNITQKNLTAGSYEYEFNGENLSSGIYYFKLQTNEFEKTMKMVLVK